MAEVLAGTSFAGSITYHATATDTPAVDEICSNVAGNKVCVNYKDEQFDWDWTAQAGDTPLLRQFTPRNVYISISKSPSFTI